MAAAGGLPAALYLGACSGHGVSVGATHHPGLGGGLLPDCPHSPLTPTIQPRPLPLMNATVLWPPTPQLPLVAVPSNVVINGNMPILDGDQLIPHPTPTTLTTISYLPTTPPCFNVQQTPAWWCTIGDAAGRELPTGHRRQLIATTKSVFINGRRLGRFADPFGTGTMPLPCSSRVGGSSPNVFVGI
tara:strand:+ start:341 stop:901 length:561 start_codon:yes stop_codon:yes gene_type:complete